MTDNNTHNNTHTPMTNNANHNNNSNNNANPATSTPTPHGKWPLRVICCGLPRAGTTSLAAALDILGFGPCWHVVLNNIPMNKKYRWFDPSGEHSVAKILEAFGDQPLLSSSSPSSPSHSRPPPINFDEFFADCKCHTAMDAPFLAIWEQLASFYPNAKIILCVREFDSWYASVKRINRLVNYTFILRVLGYFNLGFIHLLQQEFGKWFERHYVVELNTAEKLAAYIEGIKQKCADANRPLLVFDVKHPNPWQPLCEFLEVEVPAENVPFPKKNKAGDAQYRIKETLGIRAALVVGVVVVVVCVVIAVMNGRYFQ